MTADKRRTPRVDSPNLLTYVCFDERNSMVSQGMGRTLNVSEGGILLETHVPIDPQHLILLDIALEDDLMQFRGKIAHTRKREDGHILFCKPLFCARGGYQRGMCGQSRGSRKIG